MFFDRVDYFLTSGHSVAAFFPAPLGCGGGVSYQDVFAVNLYLTAVFSSFPDYLFLPSDGSGPG